MSASDSAHLQALHNDGFVKVTGLLTLEEVCELRRACQEATDQARAGKWPYIRTMPKQFPPWPSTPPPEGIWGVQHLLHPDMPGREVFAASYFNPKLLEVVEEILGVEAQDTVHSSAPRKANGGANGHVAGRKDEKLVMELYNLLVKPDSDFELRWHRDDIPPTATPSDEESALGVANGSTKAAVYSHTQWNLALEPDDSLIVVPGTHKRARTDTERNAGIHDVLSNQLTVHLEPGDVVFYDNDILHRGKYDASKERFTLHGSMGKRGFTEKRARNVLQHGVGKWIERCDLSFTDQALSLRARAMKANLVEMGAGKDVGFSQND